MPETSSDGILTARVRPGAAVGVEVDWSAVALSPWRTTVTRTNELTGEVVTVRSGDSACTPGGSGFVQDNEPPLNGYFAYAATGFDANGSAVGSSATVSVTMQERSPSECWLKSVDNPHLNAEVVVAAELSESWDRDTEVFEVEPDPSASVAMPVVWQSSAPGSYRGTLTLRLGDRSEFEAVSALAASGTLFLCAGSGYELFLPEFYLRVSAGKLTRPAGGGAWGVRWVEMPFVQVSRPSPDGAPLMVPGWSYDIRDSESATYDDADVEYATYVALAAGP